MATGDEHVAKGRLARIKGALKEGFGALTGNRTTEIEGKGERAGGALREGFGKLKNEVNRDAAADDPTRRL